MPNLDKLIPGVEKLLADSRVLAGELKAAVDLADGNPRLHAKDQLDNAVQLHAQQTGPSSRRLAT